MRTALISPADRGIPVVILAGFLGAGKTTLLNHVLANAGGRRIGVLVNDFGSVDVDSLLISGAAGGTVTLPNGCMCCTTDVDGLAEAIGSLAARENDLDAIVVEASGIAEPPALIRLVLAARSERAAYGGLVYLVDSSEFVVSVAEYPGLARHLSVADLIVCNKVDLVTAQRLDEVISAVRAVNTTASVVTVSEAAVDPGLLFDPAPERVPDTGPRQLTFDELLAEAESTASGDHAEHLHASFAEVSLESELPVDPRRLARFLERPPAGSYRIKGVVAVDLPDHRAYAYVIHSVGGVVRVTRERWAGRTPSTSLVVIGSGLDTTAAQAELAEVVGVADPADVNGILHLTRHLVEL